MSGNSVLEVGGVRTPGATAGWELPDETVSVVIAHDDAILRDMLRSAIESTGRYRVVAEAATGSEAMSLLNAHRPNLALVDLHMDGLDGLAALPSLRGCSPATGIVVYSEHSSYVTTRAAFALGAVAVVTDLATLGTLTASAA